MGRDDKAYDLNRLVEFAKENAVSFTAFYQEGGNELSIEIHGGKTENFYQKRVISIEHFIECWKEHVSLSK